MNQNNSNLPAAVQDCHQLLAWIIRMVHRDPIRRVLRGSGWNNKPENLRSANRNRNNRWKQMMPTPLLPGSCSGCYGGF